MTHSVQQRQPVAPPYPDDPHTATRHLCAAAYIDESFRDQALNEVYHQPTRVVAPSHGFNAVPVLAHCLRARNIAIGRDVAIVATLLMAAVVSWMTAVSVLLTVAQVQLVVSAWRLVRDTVRRLRDGVEIGVNVLLLRAALLAGGWTIVTAVGLGVNAQMLDGLTAGSFGYGYEEIRAQATALLVVTLVVTLLIFLYPVAWSLWRQRELEELRPGTVPAVPVDTARLQAIHHQQYANTVVYSGFTPYVGAGEIIDTWGFAQRLVRPLPDAAIEQAARLGIVPAGQTEGLREFARPPFEAEELVGYLRQHLSELAGRPGGDSEETVAGLSVQDVVMLSGTEVSHLVPYTPPETMSAVIRHPTTPARHALTCRVAGWGGEVVTFVHVHVAVQGRSLYLEFTTTALGPSDEAYRIVSSVDGHGAGAWLRALRQGITETPRIIVQAPRRLVRALIQLFSTSAGASGPVSLIKGYDYGARVGIRELGGSDARNLVQVQDVRKFKALIERRTLAAVLDFLDHKGIDTAEYRARTASALSIGNLFQGGSHAFHAPVSGGRDTHVNAPAGGGR